MSEGADTGNEEFDSLEERREAKRRELEEQRERHRKEGGPGGARRRGLVIVNTGNGKGKTTAALPLVFALGLRHGLDADHLAAIDGLTRLRPSPWNGALFALGHGGVVTALAVGVGHLLSRVNLEWLSPWLFVVIAALNLWRLLRPASHAHTPRALGLGPLLLGVILAAGFETSSQLSALALANEAGPLLLGAVFTLGMLCSDGLDGWLASRLVRAGGRRPATASRAMGWIVVTVSAAYALCDLAGVDLSAVATPLGLTLFALLLGLRLWSLRPARVDA